MSFPKEKIAGSQLTGMIVGFVFGSSVILIPGRDAGQDAWAAVLLGTMEGILMFGVYAALCRRFPDKTIVEICDLVYGRYLGKPVAAVFLWFIFHLGSLVLANFGFFFKALIFVLTPTPFILFLIVLLCIWAARAGIEVIARCSIILAVIVILLIILDTLLLMNKMKPEYLLPVLQTPIAKLLWAGHGAAAFPFMETVAFLMVLNSLNNTQEAFISGAKGLFIAGALLAFAAARNILVLGPTAETFVYPSYQAVMMINVANFLTRLEVLVAGNFLAMGFLKVAVLLYGVSLGAAQLMGYRSYQPLVYPLGILMMLLGLQNAPDTPQMTVFAGQIWPIYSIPFEIIIPVATLIIAMIRKPPKRKNQ